MIQSILNPSANKINAKVELYDGSTLVTTCTCSDRLQDFGVERVGKNNKFFGFGVFQKVIVNLIDLERNLVVSKGQIIKINYEEGGNTLYPYPTFYVVDVIRDENTNTITVTAYDKLLLKNEHTVNEVIKPYTIRQFVDVAPSLLDVNAVVFKNISDMSCFETSYPEGANFEGDELYKDALTQVAEATQTIYYVDNEDNLVFRRLSTGAADLNITKNDYYDFSTEAPRRLGEIISVTELGNNVGHSTFEGETQHVRDNPFWNNREDIDNLVSDAIDAVGGLSFTPFFCNWDGNFLLEIGDKISIVTEDNGTAASYVLNDIITFNGAMAEATEWIYDEEQNETESNPASLGAKIKQAFARVDKVNNEIQLTVSKVDSHTANIEGLTQAYDGLRQEINLRLDSESAKITAIEEELENGVVKVKTETGFTFDSDGLTIEKSNKENVTQITENGMTVYRNGSEEMLVANAAGVKATDLHARTYLTIGNTSRFEDYENGTRTGCFWIG